MSISQSGLIKWTVDSGLDGNIYKIRVLVIDQDGLAAGKNFTVTVNNAPKWSVLEVQTGKERNLITFKPSASDADGDVLVLSAAGLPDGATYDPVSGFEWIPSNGQIGSHDVQFKAVDTRGIEAVLVVTIEVKANQAPTLDEVPAVNILAGEAVNIELKASDADDEKSALSYQLINGPEEMQVSNDGLVTWETQSGVHSGEFTAEAIVLDALGAKATQPLKVIVDGAPVVQPVESLSLKPGDKVEFTVTAVDPEGGSLSYKGLNDPDGFRASPRNGLNGKFTWTTRKAELGEYKLDIEVTDIAGLKTIVAAQVTLKENVGPSLEALESVVVDAGNTLEVQAVANDVDDDNASLRYSLEDAPNGMKISREGLIQWVVGVEEEAAEYNVTVIVMDGDKAMDKQVLKVNVKAYVPEIVLLSSPSVVGPFEAESLAEINETEQTITVAKLGGMRFYKLQSGGEAKLKITSIDIVGDNVVLSYKPDGE